MSFIIVISFILTNVSMVEAKGEDKYQIKILNEVKDGNGKFVNGAKYNIYKTHDWKGDGNYKKLENRKLINQEPIVVSEQGTAYTIEEKGVYEIEQVERAPGYFSFGTFTENEEQKPLTMVVEFPKMKNGVEDSNQTIVVSPKLDPILADVGLLKVGENTSQENNGLNGVKFKLVQTHDEALKPLKEERVISENLKTSGGGFIKLNNLTEGRYELHELGTAKIDGSSPKIYADAEGTHLFDEKPILFTVTANSEGDQVRAYIHDKNGSSVRELKRMDKDEDNKIGVDYYVSKKNFRVSDIEKKVEGKDELYTNIGVDMEFTISARIPTNIEDYKNFEIYDMFDSRLDYVEGSAFLEIDGAKLSEDDYTLEYDPARRELSTKLSLGNNKFAEHAGKNVVLRFKGRLNSSANLNEEIPNTAKLLFDNGFGVDQTLNSNTVYIHPNEGSIKIIKVEEGNHDNKLAGAVFALIDQETGEVAKDVDGIEFRGITDGNGELVFEKVPFGNYQVVEEKAPLGYFLSEEKIDVELSRDSKYLEYMFIVENERDGEVEIPEDEQDDPDTGVFGPLFMIGGGLMLLGIFIYLDSTEKKKA